MGEPPESLTLQMYTTDRYRIEVPLHGTPKVYDIKTGKQISELKSRDYLAYVTKIDDGLITEYTTAQGERYGLILNDRFETLANLPGLCDISEDGRLLFDDKLGNLRQSRVYSVQELIEIAEQLYG